VVAALREVVARHPAWGVRKVWATLRRDGLVAARKRVWALMKREGLLFRSPREAAESPRGHVWVPEPNRRFATDLTVVWTRREGWVAVAPTIDCGCRSVLGLVVARSQEARVVLASVDQALEAAFGAPSGVPAGVELRTDHGSQYTGGDCRALLGRWGVEQTFSPVSRPTGNAVVERLHRTLKEEVIWLQDWEDAAAVERAVRAWVRTYNEARPHQALGWKTPSEYRAERLGGRLAMAA
jgi:putative transposase